LFLEQIENRLPEINYRKWFLQPMDDAFFQESLAFSWQWVTGNKQHLQPGPALMDRVIERYASHPRHHNIAYSHLNQSIL
jgi:hypothetical protein